MNVVIILLTLCGQPTEVLVIDPEHYSRIPSYALEMKPELANMLTSIIESGEATLDVIKLDEEAGLVCT